MKTSAHSKKYIGRFAPSPTGPLHLGSLYTALASYLEAKSEQGIWLVRIEDLDPPREINGASTAILKCLQAHGLEWDNSVVYQSQRNEAYQTCIQQLLDDKKAFYCQCSRRQLASFGGYYPGFCRHSHLTKTTDTAIRFLNQKPILYFDDQIQGQMQTEKPPENFYNDFVIYRRDRLFAYQLAVVVDDITQGVTAITRGSDILDSTYKQLALYHIFDQKPPTYSHLPVITGNNGEKLSKQNLAPAINSQHAVSNLLSCLRLLQQEMPPRHIQQPKEILRHAIRAWDKSRIPAQLSLTDDYYRGF